MKAKKTILFEFKILRTKLLTSFIDTAKDKKPAPFLRNSSAPLSDSIDFLRPSGTEGGNHQRSQIVDRLKAFIRF